jgi:hypothetical protein
VIFVAVSAAYGYFATLDEDLSPIQIDIASAAIKRHQGHLFPCDPVFGESQLWRLHTPVFNGLLELTLFTTGYRDPTLPFRAMAGVVALIYLCGMYALLYRQCRSWSVAAFVAVFSSAVTTTLGKARWGAGSLEFVTPMGICIAASPLVVLAFLRYAGSAKVPGRHQWRLPLVFVFIGLMGNLQLVAALNLTIVLLIVYLGRMRFRPLSWPIAAACALAAFLAALPYIAYFFTLRARVTQPGATFTEKAVYDALRAAWPAALYPGLARSLLSWLAYAGALCIPAAAVLIRLERFRVRDLPTWVWLIVAGLFVSLGLHGLSLLISAARHTGPPVVAFLQASAYVMLPLYVLLAQAITNLFRLVSAHRWLLRWACAAAMAAWMVPSDNLRVLRHGAYDLATMFMDEANKPLRVQELHAKRRAGAEFRNIADWAKEKQEDVNSVFVTNRNDFRMLARRSIVVHAEDIIYFYYLAPSRLGGWLDRLKRQQKLFKGPPNMYELVEFRGSLSRQRAFAKAAEWYAILPAEHAPTGGERFEVEPDGRWGKHYVVYHIPKAFAGAETKPAASSTGESITRTTSQSPRSGESLKTARAGRR